MRLIIVGHISRIEWIDKLRHNLWASDVIVDHGNAGAYEQHRCALEVAARYDERCIIIEDDAIPVEGFYPMVQQWFDRYPETLISFYLGTSRPFEWQRWVDGAVDDAAKAGSDHIKFNGLMHGLCYSIPPNEIARVLEKMQPGAADEAIGRAWGREVVYPVESLVQHRDGTPVERHPDGQVRDQPRVARKLAGPLMYG